jgi:uncharacterized protein YfaS (alpha-2-macroglobulin family)
MRRTISRSAAFLHGLALFLLSPGAVQAATVTTFSPQGEVAEIRQVRATFSESMVPFGDLRQADPFNIKCPEAGSGRWADDKTWIYDFKRDMPPGTTCSFVAKPGLKSVAGSELTGTASYNFNTGGPAVVRRYPSGEKIEENQYFALLLNGAADPQSIEKHVYCEASGISERIGVQVVTGPDREAIVKALGLVPVSDRSVVLHCKQALPAESEVTLTFGAGVTTLSGVASTADRHFKFQVQPSFTASFTCERENSHADCLPIRPMRIEFSAPIPRALAEKIVLKASDGSHKPAFEENKGEGGVGLFTMVQRGYRKSILFFGKSSGTVDSDPSSAAVTAVQFAASFPENSDISIELPSDIKDETDRPLTNIADFPIKTRTAQAPPIAKFATASFGILELNAEPLLPVTVRAVENDLNISTKRVASEGTASGTTPGTTPGTTSGTSSGSASGAAPGVVRELRLDSDQQVIDWFGRVARYQETDIKRSEVETDLGIKLPPPPAAPKPGDRSAKRYGNDEDAQRAEQERAKFLQDYLDTRSISLLTKEQNVARVSLPALDKTDPRPFEVVGIPLKRAGFYVVEIQSAKLGASLLLDAQPMYVRTTTLVTNLGVHFKLGQVNSGIWVTTLDHAKPVAGAAVQVSDCIGGVIWSGQTDANGFALMDQPMPRRALGNQCSEHGTPYGYFVSARKADAAGQQDMAFTWSTWDEGIEPWRFALASHEGSSGALVAHTVLDRRLFRAGETVSMKHYARELKLTKLVVPKPSLLPSTLEITHIGSGQTFDFPLKWRNQIYSDSTFKIPKDAKLGEYSIELKGGGERDASYSTGTFRVEEYRLPVLTGNIAPPKEAIVKPSSIPLTVQISYGNGGGASGLAVRLTAQLQTLDTPPGIPLDHYPGFHFSGPAKNLDSDNNYFANDYVGEDSEDSDEDGSSRQSAGAAVLVADKKALVLDKNGTATVTLDKLPLSTAIQQLTVEATYSDPNGEVQTLSQVTPVWNSAVVLGIKTDDWVSVHQSMATQVLALDTDGKVKAGQSVMVKAMLHQTTTIRKRLVGGFYAYDNEHSSADLGTVCKGVTDSRGLLLCNFELPKDGQVELVASADDSKGNTAVAASTVYVTKRGEMWFGSANDDRMDVLPEKYSYEPGETARFQVRMPFRSATALIAIERDGIMETRSVDLSGKDPTIEVPVKADWAPNVFVSVLAVRGRVVEVPWYSLFTWGWRHPSDWWHAWRGDGDTFQAPTAMVDLSRPAFRYGIAEIEVGIAKHRLSVEVTPDHPSYPIRATSKVHIKVKLPDGSAPAAGSEVAVAAVDEALLSLLPNPSWQLLPNMIQKRNYNIETSTAQMQIIGKRHFGKKAAPAGGGGGQFPTRELFDTLLLWNGRVTLDANGAADVSIPLNDSLTTFKIVAVADVVSPDDASLFGTGSTEIRSRQDLQISSGLPPVAREGDHMRAMVTLRNSTAAPMDVNVTASVTNLSALAPLAVHVDANGSAETGWDVDVPFNVHDLQWTIEAKANGVGDRLKVGEKIVQAVPVRVLQATLQQLDHTLTVPIAAPLDAIKDANGVPRGSIEIAAKAKLSDGMPGVTDWFLHYPWICLEQLASRSVGLRDVATWKATAQLIPLYLDSDGLADYFPPLPGQPPQGSPVLTAYLLSISDEAVSLGYDMQIPDAARQRMQDALVHFVDGRIKRQGWVPEFIRNGGLDEQKLSALEALSRAGKVTPQLITSMDLVPNQWPTSAVIDWLQILRRSEKLPKRAERIAEAEQILRSRLNFQGTRMTFSTEKDDNWWWFMANADVNSNRLLFAVLDADGWKDDIPRLVSGALQRQLGGRWSTTVANVWGSLAIERFSKKFEKDPVTGKTTAALDGVTAAKAIDWQATPSGGLIALGWPKSADKPSEASLLVTQAGGGKPWVTLTSKAAIPLTGPLSTGYRVTKTVTPTEEKVKGQVSRGDVWKVHLDIDAQADSTWVVVSDPIPTGATLLGSGLGRDSSIASRDTEEKGRAELAYEERSFEGYRAYYRYVPKGPFSIEYTVRINNPGRFGMPATHVEAMYAPEMFGEIPNAAVNVSP